MHFQWLATTGHALSDFIHQQSESLDRSLQSFDNTSRKQHASFYAKWALPGQAGDRQRASEGECTSDKRYLRVVLFPKLWAACIDNQAEEQCYMPAAARLSCTFWGAHSDRGHF